MTAGFRGQYWRGSSAVFFISVLILSSSVALHTDYSVAPEEGSIAGGTWITIRLNDSRLLNASSIKVLMTNPERPALICDIPPLIVPSASISCKTRSAGQEAVYEVQLLHDGRLVTQEAKATFKFSQMETPVIYEVSPSSGVPGGTVTVSGRIMTEHVEDYDFSADFLDGPVIMESQLDGMFSLCTLADRISDRIYPIHQEGGIGTLQCRMEGDHIGSHNLTFSVFNKGRSIVSKDAWHISAKQELFLYQTHPEIISVTPEFGSAGGGTEITIAGNFFQSPAEVIVAGKTCKIRSISPRAIICLTAPQGPAQSPPHPGNRGMQYELWEGSGALNMDAESPAHHRSVVPDGSSPPGLVLKSGQPFRARLWGFFIPPEKNNYTFWIQADNEAQLFLSPSAEADRKVEVASIPHGTPSWTDHWEQDWRDRWNQKSPKMELMGGQKYYIEMLQRGTGPKTGMKIGVQVHNTWLNPDVVSNYQREKHQIVARASRLPEIQNLTFSGEGSIRFCWDSVSSKEVNVPSSAIQIQSVIEDMISIHCATDLRPEEVLLRYGFEEEVAEPLMGGMRAAWTEPYCGRFSVRNPKYILEESNPAHQYLLDKHRYVCFGYKGYLKDYLLVSVIQDKSERKTYPCHWEFQDLLPENWKFTCTNLWTCVQNSAHNAHRSSSIYVDQILFVQEDNEEKNWYFIDEVIIATRGTTVNQIDPKAARPGGHLLETVLVTGTYPTYNLTVMVANCGINLPLIEICEGSVETADDGKLIQSLRSGNETVMYVVTRLQAASPPIGGTFSILLPDAIISGVPVDISALHLWGKLVLHANNMTAPYIRARDFTVTRDLKTCHHNVWTLSWTEMTGDLPNFIQVLAENLTGLNPTVISRVVFDGGVFIWPIFGDMLVTANSLPQVTVHVNDIPAQCWGSCTFQHLMNITPVVTDIQYSAGDTCDFTVNITGSGFPKRPEDTDVWIDGTKCNVIHLNSSSISCCADPTQLLGEHGVTVNVKPVGFAVNESGASLTVHILPSLVSIRPSVISQIGGQLITLKGVRFDGTSMVELGSSPCLIQINTSTVITCTAPSQAGDDNTESIRIKISHQWIHLQEMITFDPLLNPIIIAISPNLSSTVGGRAFINLTNFDNNTHLEVRVMLDRVMLTILSVTVHGIEVALPHLPIGLYNLSVVMNNFSLNANEVQPVIQYILEADRVEPCCGSLLGGTIIKIFGKGFPANASLISVTIGTKSCEIINSNADVIKCRTPSLSLPDSDEESFKAHIMVSTISSTNGTTISNASNNDLMFTYHRNLTLNISHLSWLIENGSLWLNLSEIHPTFVILFENAQCGEKHQMSYAELQSNHFEIPLQNFTVGIYLIEIYNENVGFARIPLQNQTFEILPVVFLISPGNGSLCGGSILEIHGSFYKATNSSVLVKLSGSYICTVITVNSSVIQCRIKTVGDPIVLVDINVEVTIIINDVPSICVGSCSLHLASELTPVIKTIQPRLEGTSLHLHVSGQRLDEKVHILVDGIYKCLVTFWNQTLIKCNLEETIPLGGHSVSVQFAAYQSSCLSGTFLSFTIVPPIKLYPVTFGVNGGGCLTIEGAGLQGRISTIVQIGSCHHCLKVTFNHTMIKCILPPVSGAMSVKLKVDNYTTTVGTIEFGTQYTPEVHSILEAQPAVKMAFSGITAPENLQITLKEYQCQNITGNTSVVQCVPPALPAGRYEVACLDVERGWATSNVAFTVPLLVTALRNNIDCRNNRSLHILGTGFAPGKTSVTICGSLCQISNHLSTTTDLYCSDWTLNSSWSFLCDLRLKDGAPCHENTSRAILCDVTVRVGTFRVTESLEYLHLCHPACQCDSLSLPAHNGTPSATNITGLFISPKVEKDEVLIYIGWCSVVMATEAEMECRAPNQPIISQITAIRESWLQNTQDDTPYHFCSFWWHNSSWPSGHPPLDGDNVTVERGRTLLLDGGTGRLNLLHVKGGSLVFIGQGPIHLHAHYILVSDGGKIQVGTESLPFEGKAKITLYGSSDTAPIYPYGVKFLAVRNGTISIHGWAPKIISTHLAEAVRANSTDLVLVDAVDWRVGDEVVLCGGSGRGSNKREEVLTIKSVNGTHLTVTSLRYSYDIVQQTVGADQILLRPIIALLSRDIVVQGNRTDQYMRRYQQCQQAGISDLSECPYDTSESKLGSRDLGMVFMTQALKDERSLVHLSGVQFLFTGQAFRKALSSINFIGNGTMQGSYIQRCVVMNSFARGIHLSGVSDFMIKENIFYNISGHGVIIGEHSSGSQIKNNLLIKILGSNSLSNIETLAPAAVYIWSPSNAIEDNTVCSSGYGFLYHLPSSEPSKAAFGSFRGNKALSCTRSGLWIHPEYTPDAPSTFQDFMAWKSRGGAQISRCENLSFIDFRIYSCQDFGINITESRGNTSISQSLLLGHFDAEDKACTMSGIITPKRSGLLVSNTTFMNFDNRACSAFQTCSSCMKGQGGFTIKTQSLTFVNSPSKCTFPFAHCAVIEDADGSFFGWRGSHILPTTEILPESCLIKEGISGGVPASVCPAGNKFHRMAISLERKPAMGFDVTVTNSRNGSSTVNYLEDTLSSLYGWQALLLGKETYTLRFHYSAMRNAFNYSGTFDNFEDGDFLFVQHQCPEPINISVTCGLVPGRPQLSVPVLEKSQACDWFYDGTLGVLTYLVAGEGQIRVTLRTVEYATPPAAAPTPGSPLELLWSSPESWAGVGEGWGGHGATIPQPGDDVIILPNRTIVVDVALPPLRGLYVLGILEFTAQSSNVLNVTCILIVGGELRVGQPKEPLEWHQRLHILLRASEGVHCDRLSGLHVSPGVIEVYGKFRIHSAYSSKPWTHLGADLAPGNEMMALNGTIDWHPGDEIVIASTSYEAHQAERAHLRDVYGYMARIWGRVKHRHTGTTYNIDNTWRIPLAAEVGLLTRNVLIEADIPCAGRIIVGESKSSQGDEYKGTLELFNVEISNLGSPSYSAITFTQSSSKSSIISSSIQNLCGGGIHSTKSSNIVLHSNVLFNITGHGIHIDGDNHTITDNLLILIQQPGGQSEWVKGIKVRSLPGQALLSGNAVAGSERIAYHIKGQSCSSEEASVNVAHSSLHGLHLSWDDGIRNCTKISGFICYKNYDYGLVFFLVGEVVVDNIALVDNGVAILPTVSPDLLDSSQHEKQNITLQNSLIVATSPAFDCLRDRITPSSALPTMPDRAPASPFGGRVGILWPSFPKHPCQWPVHPWHLLGSEAVVPGIMRLQDVTFAGFKRSCFSNDADVCIMSNPGVSAIESPIIGQRVKMLQVQQENMFYFPPSHRNLECLNFLECAQTALFKILDGSSVGFSSPVTIFPKPDIYDPHPCLEIYPNKDRCTYLSSSRGYICQQIDLTVVILEIIAPFVEAVSPVVTITDHFHQVFVTGGTSQDGCCDSTNHTTFYSILPANKISHVCFNGRTPKALRLQLHGAQDSTRLVMALFYDVPNGFFVVSRGKKYATVYDKIPEFLSQEHGSSFFSFRENLLYVVLQGNEPVEVWTKQVLQLFFFVTPGRGEDPYKQLPQQLALFLSIDVTNVKLLQVLQGSDIEAITDNLSKRKRHCPSKEKVRRVRRHSGPNVKRTRPRQNQESQVDILIVEISDQNVIPKQNLSSRTVASSLKESGLQSLLSRVIGALQTGEMEGTLQAQIDSVMVIGPELGNSNRSRAEQQSIVYVRPRSLYIAIQPSGSTAGMPLVTQPKVTFLDAKGQRVTNVGYSTSPWYLAVYLKDSSRTLLKGNTMVAIEDGWGNFSNLAVSSPGSNWRLIFNVTSPAGVFFSAQSQEFQVLPWPNQDVENIILLVVLSSSASAVVLLLFFCYLFKRSKGIKHTKAGNKLRS